MPTTYTDVDRLILERWDDTRGLMEAYEELQDRMHDVIEEVGERLARWAEEKGYTLDTDAKAPAYYLYRPSWMNRRRDDAVIYFLLSDFAPVGYRRVKEEHPSLWLQTGNLQMLKMKEVERAQFCRDLRSRLGETGKTWMHEDANESDSPLGKSLMHISDSDRVRLISDPDHLFEFASVALQDAFPLSDAIEQSLATARARE